MIHNIQDPHQYMCNTNLESFSNVVGILPLESRPVLEYMGQRLTALTVTQVHEHTVAFLGTSYGRLKKVCWTSGQVVLDVVGAVVVVYVVILILDILFQRLFFLLFVPSSFLHSLYYFF